MESFCGFMIYERLVSCGRISGNAFLGLPIVDDHGACRLLTNYKVNEYK